jgi:predicted enzyme related to lactoylglutathione lyase
VRTEEDEMERVGRVGWIQVDCANPAAIAEFWSKVLEVTMEEPLGDPPHYLYLGAPADASGGPTLAFQRVPEPKTVKNRMHIDVAVDDVELATTQILALGGSRAPSEDFSEYGFRWRVMADPDDNEFCLIYTSPESDS